MSNNKVIEFYKVNDTTNPHRSMKWYVPLRYPEYKEFCKQLCLGYSVHTESVLGEHEVKRIGLKDPSNFQSMRFLTPPASDLQSWLQTLTAPPKRPLKGRGYAAAHMNYIDMLDFINVYETPEDFNRYAYLRVVYEFLANYGHVETKPGVQLASFRISPEAACALIAVPNAILKLAKFVI